MFDAGRQIYRPFFGRAKSGVCTIRVVNNMGEFNYDVANFLLLLFRRIVSTPLRAWYVLVGNIP